MKIFIIAGEESGDKLGSAIIDGLMKTIDVPPKATHFSIESQTKQPINNLMTIKLNLNQNLIIFYYS